MICYASGGSSKRGFNSLDVLSPSSTILCNLEDAISGKRSRVSSSVSISEQEEASVCCTPLPVSPELCLIAILQDRGYSTARRTSIARGYCTPPHRDEVMLYDMQLVQAVRNHDVKLLAQLLDARPDCARACNKFGESVSHTLVAAHPSKVCLRSYAHTPLVHYLY